MPVWPLIGTTEERTGRRADVAAHADRVTGLLAPLEASGELPANCAPALAWARGARAAPARARSWRSLRLRDRG